MIKVLSQQITDQLPTEAYWTNSSGTVTTLNHLDYISSFGANIDSAVYSQIAALEDVGESGSYPEPIFLSASRTRFAINKPNITLVVNGSFFNPWTEFTSDVVSIVSTEYISSLQMVLVISTIDNTVQDSGSIFIEGKPAFDLTLFQSTWIDLRTGGENLTSFDLISITQGDVTRDAGGTGAEGAANWADALGLSSVVVPRDHSNGIRLVFQIQSSGAAMFGMFASGRDVDTTMYDEQHVGFYLSNPQTLWGFYAFSNQGDSRDISAYNRLKAVFPTTLSPGSAFEVWGLTEGETWDDGDLLITGTVPGGTQDAGETLYPCILPSASVGARLQAFNTSGAD